jgi:hypothetical protein
MRALMLLAVSAALLAGCGANDPLAAEEISAAAQETAESGSSRIEISGTDGDDRFTMSGLADYEAGVAQLAFSGTADGAEQSGEFRLVDETFYGRAEQLGVSGMPEGKSWFAFTIPEEERNESLDALVLPFPFIDPAALLANFQEVGGEPKRLGERDVRGVPTEGYELALDLAKLVERAPAKYRGTLRSELERRAEKTLPVEVWIDDADRARRIVVEIEGEAATFDFFDFGLEVDVQAPPPAEVLELSDLTPRGESATEEDG